MMNLSFFNRQTTAVAALIQGTGLADFISQARAAEFDGADAIAAELCLMPPAERTEENFRSLMDAVKLPFMFLDYRNDVFLGGDDAARQACLLCAARAGAEVIDVMGDLYNPSPRELTRDPEAVKRQKRLISDIHAVGGKVLISSHTGDALRAEEVLEHLRTQADRGADIVKIVTGSNSEAEFLEAIRTTMLLNRELSKPFIHLTSGTFGRIHRFLGPQLGCAVEFAIQEYREPHVFPQPTIRAFKAVMNNIHWRL